MNQTVSSGACTLSALEQQVERMGNCLLESEMDTFLQHAQDAVKAVVELRRCASAQAQDPSVNPTAAADRVRLQRLASQLQNQRDALARRSALVNRTLEVLLPGRT